MDNVGLIRFCSQWHRLCTLTARVGGPKGPRSGARMKTRSDVKTQSERTDSMKKVLASVLSVVTMVSLSATAGMAQTSCPPEVASAKAMLSQTAKSQDVQAQ